MKKFYTLIVCFVCLALQPELSAQKKSNWRDFVDISEARLIVKDTLGALMNMGKLVDIVPDSADVYKFRALLFQQLGKPDDAIEDFGRAIKLNDTIAEYYLLRGTLYTSLRLYAQAIKDFSLAIVVAPDVPDGYYHRGNTAMQMGDYSSAEADFDDFIRLTPGSSLGYIRRASTKIMAKQLGAALTDLNLVIKMEPLNAEAYFLRGSIMMDSNKTDLACQDWVEAAKLGYKAALDASRSYCRNLISTAGFDSLRTYVMPEITVEAQSDQYRRAAQEIQVLSKQTQNIARRSADLAAVRQSFGRPQGGLGGGSAANYRTKDAIVSRGAQRITSLGEVVSKSSNTLNLDDMIFLLRERLRIINDEKTNAMMKEIMGLRNKIASQLEHGTAEGVSSNLSGTTNANFIRDDLDQISRLMRKISEYLDSVTQK